MRQANARGVTVEGRHYSLYEATQMQRKMERGIRKQKKRILVDKATGDEEKLLIDRTRLRMQNANYKKFSEAAGLRTQRERAQVAGFGRKEATEAEKQYRAVAKSANSMYNKGDEDSNIAAWMRDKPIRDQIRSDPEKLIINPEKQARHVKGADGYISGRSYITVSNAELQGIVNQYAGTGEIQRSAKGSKKSLRWTIKSASASIPRPLKKRRRTGHIFITANPVRMLSQQVGRRINDNVISIFRP